MKQKVCRCEAYNFPHRKYGGKCEAYDPDRPSEDAADRWLMGLMERRERLLDDPRHVPYSNLRRK